MLPDEVAIDAGMERALRRHEPGIDTTLCGKNVLDGWLVGPEKTDELRGDGGGSLP